MPYQSENSLLTLALSGDTILSRRLAVFQEPEFHALRQIFREADASFTNLESAVHRYENTPGITAGTFTCTTPESLEDLKWFGINMVSCANNHIYDWGEAGVLATIRYVEDAGIVYAGAGPHLSAARAPGYLDTPNGRVALVAVTSFFRPWNVAAPQGRDILGRPGVNFLRFQTSYEVDKRALADLRRINTELGLGAEKERIRNSRFFGPGETSQDTDTEFHFNFSPGGLYQEAKFTLGESFAIRTSPHAGDMKDILRWVKDAHRQADVVVVSHHYHEQSGESFKAAKHRSEIEQAAEFVREFALGCFAAGADVFVGHGPHRSFGVEIYQGHPIFYSLGGLIHESDTMRWLPPQAYSRFDMAGEATPADFFDRREGPGAASTERVWWENVIAKVRFQGHKLNEVVLYPLDQGFGTPRSQRGRPILARGEQANHILQRISRLSEPYGTRIEIKDSLGIIKF